MSIVLEGVTIDCPGPDLVHINHSQVMSSGIDMGRELLLSRTSTGWLATTLRRFLASPQSRVEHTSGDDHLTVFERGQEPSLYIHIHNTRSDGWNNSIILSPPAVETLIEKLEAL